MYIIVAHIYSLPLAYTSLYTNRYQSLPIATNRPRMPPEFPLLPEHSGVLQPEATWPWAAEALRIHLQFLVKGLVLGCSLFCNWCRQLRLCLKVSLCHTSWYFVILRVTSYEIGYVRWSSPGLDMHQDQQGWVTKERSFNQPNMRIQPRTMGMYIDIYI